MRQVSYICMIGLVLLLHTSVNAQTDSVKSNTQFKLGVYYNSHLNYYGRTDSLRSSGVFPLAELWLTPSFYINAAPVFVNNTKERFQYAGTVTTAGYQFNDQKNWAGNFYIVKPFYKQNSQLVQSALKLQLAGTITKQGKIISITGGADVKFSDKTDYGATAGIDHLFKLQLPERFIVIIDPSVYVNAGTQQFTNTYNKKNNFLLFPGTEQQVTENVNKFNILSYELSMPVVVAKGKFQLLVIPSYVMPQNLVTVSGQPGLSEQGENLLYVTAGIKVIFN